MKRSQRKKEEEFIFFGSDHTWHSIVQNRHFLITAGIEMLRSAFF